MLRAYFDTSVPSGIVDGKVPANEIDALKAAFTRKDLIAPIGPIILDELFGELEIDRAAMIRKLQVLRHFDTFRSILKMPMEIFKEAIEAYAADRDPSSPFVPEEDRTRVVSALIGVIAGSRRHDGGFKEAIIGVDELKISWLSDMLEAQRDFRTHPNWIQIEDQARKQVSFANYFAWYAPQLTSGFANWAECGDACERRGISGLLLLPVVRICVGVALSQVYAQVVGTPGQPDLRRPARGDGYDIWHAILASTADVFVTFDKRLADHVERIPDLQTPRIVRSIRELLGILRRVSGISSDTN